MKNRLPLVLLATLAAPAAEAHEYELGFSIEPTVIFMPAVAQLATHSTLAPAAGGSLSFEYYPIDHLALVLRGGYVEAFGDSFIAQATFDNRTGSYYLQENGAYGFAGLRLETPSWLLPLSFFVSACGGMSFLDQTQRDLRDTNNISYGLGLSDQLQIVPTLTGSVGLAGRVSNQIRLDLEPTLYVFLTQPLLYGFGLSLGLTFLFYP